MKNKIYKVFFAFHDRKVLAAMAIAKEKGLDRDGFNYEKVIEYLVDSSGY